MSDLFMRRSAVISDCGLFRSELRRDWDDGLPLLPVCMLNPSTADHEREDPTLLALIWFAKLWGYGGLLIVNLYDFRASKPEEMFAAPVKLSLEGERRAMQALFYARDNGGRMLAAWGNAGADRATFYADHARCNGVELICLGTTQSGAPKHPMARGQHRIPRDQQPIIWRAAA
jgi:hypothetical protein